MVTRIPNEASLSHATTAYSSLSARRSLNLACSDVQATLSSFRFCTDVSALSESPSVGPSPSAAAAASTMLYPSEDDEYVEPSCMPENNSRRPSVQRTSSAPEPSSSKSALFVEPSGPSVTRLSLARSCSESRAFGVLERRRRNLASRNKKLPSSLNLDLTELPMIMGAGNIGLLRAARKAIAEPSGFDWGRAPISAPQSSTNSLLLSQLEQKPSWCSPGHSVKVATTMSLPASASASKSSSPESNRVANVLPSSQSYVGSYWSNHTSVSDESEFDWALAGNARATHEVLRFSNYKEKREPVHDIWFQLPDWMSRRSSCGGRDADQSLRGPGLYSAFGPSTFAKDPVTATTSSGAVSSAALSFLAQAAMSDRSPRSSISGRGRVAQTKVSVHVPYRVIEELPPHEEDVSPRGSVAACE